MREAATAVIPTTGTRLKKLVRALDSVRLQSRPVAEIVIVVDADELTSAGVRNVVANMDFRCPVIIERLDGSTGPSAARNLAAELSNSAWVAFLDDDDVWEPDKLLKQLSWATNRGLDVCGTRSTLMTPAGTRTAPPELLEMGDSVVDYFYRAPSILRPSSYISTPSIVVKRNWLVKHPFPEEYRNLEDIAWLISLYRSGARIGMHPEALVRIDEMDSLDRQSRRSDSRAIAAWAEDVLGDFPRARANFMATSHVRSVAVSDGFRSALIAWGKACISWPPPRFQSAIEGLLLTFRPSEFPVWVQRILRHIRR